MSQKSKPELLKKKFHFLILNLKKILHILPLSLIQPRLIYKAADAAKLFSITWILGM